MPEPTAQDRPAGSTEVAENQPPAPSLDPSTAEPILATSLPVDALPFDLSAVQRSVDGFFAGLADLAREGGVGASVPLVPAAVVVVTALAYECGRRWGAKTAAALPPEEDLVADLTEEE